MDQRRSSMKTVSPGIRQKENGKYLATKSISGERYYQEFDKEKDAVKWRKTFHPLLSPTLQRNKIIPTVSDQSNGKGKIILLGDVLELYQKGFLRTLQAYTQYKKMQRLAKFTPNLIGVPMCAFTPDVITNHLDSMRLTIGGNSRRCNFDKELKDLSSVFNWYKTKDFTFVNPVQGIHYKIGKIQEVPEKPKDMDMEEFDLFISKLSPMYFSMAVIMFLWGLRIGEAAALTDDVINWKKKEAFIFNVIVWLKGRPEIKRGTKTGADAKMPIIDVIEVEIKKLQASRPNGCKFLFHHKGKPLRYAMILKEFNRALQEAGLPYSGTHVIRHTMATITRKTMGLDAAQAILRHTTARMSEEYAKLDVDERVSSVVIHVGDLFKRKRFATECDRAAIS
jgi:integrase